MYSDWYWVLSKDSSEWFPTKKSDIAAGGWTNEDTWEDFNNEVISSIRIPYPIKETYLGEKDA